MNQNIYMLAMERIFFSSLYSIGIIKLSLLYLLKCFLFVLNCHLNLLPKYVVSRQCANTELGALNINKLCQPSK